MSWKNSLLNASFRGVTFHCQATDDQTERALAVHHYPFRDGGTLDDMGRKARPYTITAVFWGNSYEGELANFVTALDEGGEGEFIHPVFGVRPVMVQQYSIPHEAENPDYCTVSVTFLESGQDIPFFARASSPMGRAANAVAAIKNALAEVKNLCTMGVKGWVGWLVGQLPGSGLLAEVSNIFTTATAIYNEVTEIANLAIDLVSYPQALVSQLEDAASQVIQSVTQGPGLGTPLQQWQTLSNHFPGRSLTHPGLPEKAKIYSAAPLGENSLGPLPPHNTAYSFTAGLPPVWGTPQEEAAALATFVTHAVQTAALAEVVCEMLLEEAETPTLNPAEVEVVVANTRQRLEDCITISRAILPEQHTYPMAEHLRTAALEIRNLGLAVLHARPPLVTHTLETPCNHHLLAHRLYKDHTRAPELLRLNPAIRFPSFLERGQKIKAYAK